MEMKVIEDKKNRLVFELHGEGATFCHILKEELWNDKSITAASYREDHPMIKTSILTVETKGTQTPRKALEDAVKRLKKLNSDFEKEVKKKF